MFVFYSMSQEYRFPRHVSRLRIWLKGGNGGSKVTYWSSTMSSRVRASNKEWISGLERTVSGILISGLKYLKRQMLYVVFLWML